MDSELRLCFLVLYAVGPAVALLALARRAHGPTIARERLQGWRWYVPSILLPVEWLVPPALIFLAYGEVQAGWLPVRLLGLAVGLLGAILIIWASIALGRFLVHEAAIF